MKYVINVKECEGPGTARFWGEVEGLPGCHISEETLNDLHRAAPLVIKAVIQDSNGRGGCLPLPTGFEIRIRKPVGEQAVGEK